MQSLSLPGSSLSQSTEKMTNELQHLALERKFARHPTHRSKIGSSTRIKPKKYLITTNTLCSSDFSRNASDNSSCDYQQPGFSICTNSNWRSPTCFGDTRGAVDCFCAHQHPLRTTSPTTSGYSTSSLYCCNTATLFKKKQSQ